ncbi:exo-beta-N-acetylmuramidase NamZ family protein [Kriegella aquimaris]|uniref:Uncharacterized conserved protein YbbC, DUF1343 family n=1 Tax=Kriegella aquimaris TaxID=192904 RepID=A0A1G9V395_9FLAO|nr:DUF1343 domain-containing protein [Kriegella aquimaris]SDM66599.1 Uncharacterized conserved protein YbbC, DUF1343 family [Kriegella aquimaris]
MQITGQSIQYLQKKTQAFLIILVFIFTSTFAHDFLMEEPLSSLSTSKGPVKVGADRLFSEYAHLIKGKKLALVSNHTGRLSNGVHLADSLFNYPHSELIALFGMHFNIRTNDYSIPKDKEVDIDVETGLPKYSLYGSHHKPTPQMLKDVQVIIFDIQEVGARFYEHVNILGFVMEAAAENDIEVVVLDRPNPITGVKMDGFLTGKQFLFGFGAFGKIPVIHGMTIGELANLYNGENMLRGRKKAKLHVIEMLGWKRSMWLDQTGLKWVKPSPNLPSLESLIAYTGTCLFEGLNISAGRGTEKPFQYIGAPWINNDRVVELLNNLKLKGVQFDTVTFTPKKMSFHGSTPYLGGEVCKGIYVNITNRDFFESYKAGIAMVWAIHKVHPDQMEWNKKVMDRLISTKRLEDMIYGDAHPYEIFASWQPELSEFKEIGKNYFLY